VKKGTIFLNSFVAISCHFVALCQRLINIHNGYAYGKSLVAADVNHNMVTGVSVSFLDCLSCLFILLKLLNGTRRHLAETFMCPQVTPY